MSWNNQAILVGEFESGFMFDHRIGEEKFYLSTVATSRNSGTVDHIPVVASKSIAEKVNKLANTKYEVRGKFVAYPRKRKDAIPKMKYFIFADSITQIEERYKDENDIYLRGHVSAPTFLKVTPWQERKITNILLSVGTRQGEKVQIPTIAWGNAAEFASYALKQGDEIEVWGRIQSRPYFKKEAPGSERVQSFITYEVSIHKLVKL